MTVLNPKGCKDKKSLLYNLQTFPTNVDHFYFFQLSMYHLVLSAFCTNWSNVPDGLVYHLVCLLYGPLYGLVYLFSRGKLLPRTRFTVARGLRRSNLTVARGLRRTRFTVARGLRRTRFTSARASCDRHLCRKRPPEELFYGRKRILYSIIV